MVYKHKIPAILPPHAVLQGPGALKKKTCISQLFITIMKYKRLLKKKRGLFNSKFGEGPLSCIHVMVNDNGRSICARKQLHLETES